jgi:two-component system, chemotaxis family, protein-glutamate methylesterase/glutaminase
VQDRTGLTGRYNVELEFDFAAANQPEAGGPSIFTALKRAIGPEARSIERSARCRGRGQRESPDRQLAWRKREAAARPLGRDQEAHTPSERFESYETMYSRAMFTPSKGHNIIVVGTSAGGLEALDALVSQLPTDLACAIFIVQHMAPENTGIALLSRLGRYRAFRCSLATNEERFEEGRIYIAPADHHLLIKKDHVLVTKGARENRYRPGIDPLFRSAAATHGPSVIAVLLTGALDDGTAGLLAVKKCGGITIVQDPKDAAYPEMPQSALNAMDVNHCVPISEMGGLLEKYSKERPGKGKPVPEAIRTEAEIAERVLSDVSRVAGLGEQVPYNCPNCGGVLWEMKAGGIVRYRCHTGHSYTGKALVTSQTEKIEETLWISLRMFEERKNLLNNLSRNEKFASAKHSYSEQAKATQIHIERIRAMLLAETPEPEEE